VTVFYNIQTPELNQGFTFTDTRLRKSIMVIGLADSKEQFMNTVVHEAKHLQSSICRYYNVSERSEDAAYLIGFIVMTMVRFLNNF
jgi:hypothetical protein